MRCAPDLFLIRLRECLPLKPEGYVLTLEIHKKPAAENATAGETPAFSEQKSQGDRRDAASQKRSWTQLDLDDAIQEYKARRAGSYNDLVDAVKRGKRGAKESARRLFGRNQLARTFGVKSPAMVTNSPVWQGIADALGLRKGRRRRLQQQRIGLDIALEEQAVADDQPALDQVIRRETIALVEKSMPKEEAEATIEKLHRREITDDEARELVELCVHQRRDERARRVR